MAFDYKKEYKEYYMPKAEPALVTVPPMRYLAVSGAGDPNQEGGAYQEAVGLLYGVAFTLKMSQKANHQMAGYFDYVMPPLEGFWRQEGVAGFDYTRKELFQWLSVIRVPDFVTEADFRWALAEAERKKKQDFSKVEFRTVEEGLCVQILHIGAYDDEPASVARMDAFLERNGYEPDFEGGRLHHEIYLSDARRVEPARRKTVIRHPIRVRSELGPEERVERN